jgi:predicted phosphodiesterase|tara:strand:- start:261 stop:1445 length:1185 start_codon:yes stop_codon:yes gene_type:complete
MFCKNCFAPNLIKCGFEKGRQRYECNVCGHKSVYVIENLELIQENVRLAKQKQSAQDRNRIQNKSFREYARVENAVSEYTKQLTRLFDKYKLSTYTQKHSEETSCVGVIQFSDVHFNELVDLPHNKYDFTVASKRCKHFVNQATKYFKAFGVTNVLMVQSGDLLNSDRRLDELLNMATNRAKATFLAVDILQQVIMDLNSNFNVSVAMVTGNESRVKKDWGWSGNIASDNYDYTIFQTLRYIFRDTDIAFVDGDPTEVVVEVAGQNLLVLHGNGSIKKGIDTSITQIMGRYRARGIDINYVIFGHIHSARVGDNFSRSSSMVGANDYSEKALNLSGRASQNCYIFYDNGNRDGIKVDLQNYSDDMYDIEKSLESYNAKSHEKLNVGKTIFKVVV